MISPRSVVLQVNAIACCLFLFLLSACSIVMPANSNRILDIGDGGFLSGEPCGPPCFWGITPGVTTEGEATQVLKSKNVFQTCTPYNNEAEGALRGISCNVADIRFRRGTNIVEGVAFSPSRSLTTRDLIAKYGPPTRVLVTSIGSTEKPNMAMSLFYEAIKVQLGLPTQKEFSPSRVEPTTQIVDIGYFDASSYEATMERLPNLPQWTGYGAYPIYDPYKH